MPDELITFLGLGALVALLFLTPRKVRGHASYPASAGTKAIGTCLLVLLAVAMIAGIICRQITAPGR